MHRTWTIAAALVTLCAAARSIRAQEAITPATPAAPAATTPATVGPTANAAALSPRLSLDAVPATTAQSEFAKGLTRGQKFMILGGAILITGAIIGGDAGTIIMIGGGAVGIYGLYLQLGQPRAGATEELGLSRSF